MFPKIKYIPKDTKQEDLIGLKPWSETDNEIEQQEILEKWEAYYKSLEEIERLNKSVHLSAKEQKLAEQIRIERAGPTFEEWKKAQGIEKRKQIVTPKKKCLKKEETQK